MPTAGDGRPVLLQCRPLTAVAAPGREAPRGRRWSGWPSTPWVGDTVGGIAVVDRLTTADYGIVFRSAAVVMQQEASSLSHVAILCRELGVPLVCGVAGARSLIGRRVAVDTTRTMSRWWNTT